MADPEVRPGSEADASGSGSGDQGDRDLDENLFADTLPDLGDSSSPMVAESGVGEANFQDPEDVIDYHSDDDSMSTVSSRQRRFQDEDVSSEQWRRHRKHVFILSSAGKPIYTRYGDENKLSSFTGVLQALISFVRDDDENEIQYVVAGDHTFVFLVRGSLYYVCVARTKEPPAHIELQLHYMHLLIVSILTEPYIEKLFRQKPQFDLRRMLGGTDNLLDSLCLAMDSNPSFFLGAAHCLRLSNGVRNTIGTILQSVTSTGLVYAVLVAGGQLVTLVRPRRSGLHPYDLILLLNYVNSVSGMVEESGSESWAPLCLPKFNSTGHLHVYVHYIAAQVGLIFVSTDQEKFFELSEERQRVVGELRATAALEAIDDALARQYYSVAEIGIPGLLHFLYKSTTTRQFTMPLMEAPYIAKDQKRLFRLYQHVQNRVRNMAEGVKVFYQVSQSETVLAWVTSGFELYVVFGPLVQKPLAITSCNRLLRWIKREEGTLFVLNSPVW